MQHKYDSRGSGREGDFAQELWDKVCKHYNYENKPGTHKEDCEGIDRHTKWGKADVKARKNRMPANTCWIELSAAGNIIGTGWAYKNKYVTQLMIYEEDNKAKRMIFGVYDAKDLVNLLKAKVDFNAKCYRGELYKIYTRRQWETKEHRGDLTVVSYADLESLPSFEAVIIPEIFHQEVKDFYGY